MPSHKHRVIFIPATMCVEYELKSSQAVWDLCCLNLGTLIDIITMVFVFPAQIGNTSDNSKTQNNISHAFVGRMTPQKQPESFLSTD